MKWIEQEIASTGRINTQLRLVLGVPPIGHGGDPESSIDFIHIRTGTLPQFVCIEIYAQGVYIYVNVHTCLDVDDHEL